MQSPLTGAPVGPPAQGGGRSFEELTGRVQGQPVGLAQRHDLFWVVLEGVAQQAARTEEQAEAAGRLRRVPEGGDQFGGPLLA